jgi:transcriptional regulator with XRE-family HTH domain
MADPRRVEFGDFLRSRREKLSPKTVGLPAGRRRRTAGLRREEVAQLAGIGVDWYIRLEQGRTVSPSVTTIDALARALRLSKTEHAHLKALARDGDRRAFTREIVPPPIRRMKSMVAMFRATHDVWAGDPAFTELLTRLRQGSPEFVKWWEAHEIRSTAAGLKTMNHPTKGVLRFEHTSFQANDDPALKLVIYTPV